MYNEYLVECGDCNDRFKMIYDSRKDEQEVCVCKCGKLEIYPELNYFTVNGCGKYKDVPHEEQEYKYEYYEEDYIKLTDEHNKLIQEISEIGLEVNKKRELEFPFYLYNDKEFINISLSGISKYGEKVDISFNIKLLSRCGWSSEEVNAQHERLTEGLNMFKDIITKVNNGEIDLKKPYEISDDDTLDWFDVYTTQIERYHYEYLC